MAVKEVFGGNVSRLLGMHDLSARDASQLLGISSVALSQWRTGKRGPSLDALLRLGQFFEVPTDRLMTEDFSGLLAGPLADVERFERVEAKIARARRGLKVVRSDGEAWEKVKGETLADRRTGRAKRSTSKLRPASKSRSRKT